MFIALALAIALVLTVKGGTEERDLIGWYLNLLLTVYNEIGYINGVVAFCKFSINLVVELGAWLLTISCCLLLWWGSSFFNCTCGWYPGSGVLLHWEGSPTHGAVLCLGGASQRSR